MNEIPVKIRNATRLDLAEIKCLFYETINFICKNDYSPEQIRVWSDKINNEERWENIISFQHVLIAEDLLNNIVGFASILEYNYIDMLYVHKDYQRVGIAKLLYLELEKYAITNDSNILSVNASHTAKSFFEKMGFQTLFQQTFLLDQVEISNFRMEKKLNNI
jgi:putative acetyltransferase